MEINLFNGLIPIESAGIDDLIVDLRDNPGGYMQDAVQMVSQFIPQKGQLLVYTKSKDGRKREYKSNGRNFFPIQKLVILINGNSASASEIVAGVIQDLDRGVIMGNPSFGKGLVQQQFDLTDGSAVYITTERYYTPSGRLIQKPYRYKDEIFSNHHAPDTTPYFTRKGDSVLASGGIVPDIVVPIRQNVSEALIGFLNQHGIYIAYQWIQENNEVFRSMENIQNLVSKNLVGFYADYAGIDQVQISEDEQKFIKQQLIYAIYKFKDHIEALDWYMKQDEQVKAAIAYLS